MFSLIPIIRPEQRPSSVALRGSSFDVITSLMNDVFVNVVFRENGRPTTTIKGGWNQVTEQFVAVRYSRTVVRGPVRVLMR